MSLILGSKRALFDHYIVESKLNADAFEITKVEDAPQEKGSVSVRGAGTGEIKVTYRPSGISRQYRDGVVPPPWLQFDLDLKGNFFGTH